MLLKKLGEVATFDLCIRTNVQHEEAGVHARPAWLGEWVARGIPMGHGPLKSLDSRPASVVPIEARALTLEQAEREPEWD